MKKLLSELNENFPELSKIDKFNIVNFLPTTPAELYLTIKSSVSKDEIRLEAIV